MNAMKEFQDLVPEELRSTEMPKSWSDVELAVSTVQAEWEIKTKESHGARARHWVRKMCTGLHNHSAVLNMLPTNNEYVSLISGAVVMIIKVGQFLSCYHLQCPNHGTLDTRVLTNSGLSQLLRHHRVIRPGCLRDQ